MLVVLTSYDPFDTVLNFVALAVITEFDNYSYESIQSEPLKKLTEGDIEGVLPVCHTSSVLCEEENMSGAIGKDGTELKTRIKFTDRTVGNMIAYSFYKVMRVIYISFYFYFMPFTSIICSVLIPNWFDKLDSRLIAPWFV